MGGNSRVQGALQLDEYLLRYFVFIVRQQILPWSSKMTRLQYGGREHDYNRRPDSVLDTIFVVEVAERYSVTSRSK